jgi:hypothetical protein
MSFFFVGNLLFIAAPQLVAFFIGLTARLRAPAVLGGLLALDIWLIYFEWLLLHSTKSDSMAWIIYWAASLPVSIVGVLLGIILVGLTRSCSQRLRRRYVSEIED